MTARSGLDKGAEVCFLFYFEGSYMKASRWNCVLPLVLTVVTLSLMSERFALAQAGTGSIRGLVTDASGAVLPDVQIEATNVATQLKFSTTTTGAGIYTLSSLPIGVYKVVVQHTGFKQSVQENVDIATGSTTTLNIALEVGEV